MSDVIEVMEKSRNEYLSDQGRFDGTTREMIVYMLDAAEQAGWRLVPVWAGNETREAIEGWLEFPNHADCIWRDGVEAAPRPWDDA